MPLGTKGFTIGIGDLVKTTTSHSGVPVGTVAVVVDHQPHGRYKLFGYETSYVADEDLEVVAYSRCGG